LLGPPVKRQLSDLIVRARVEACHDENLRIRVVSLVGNDELTFGVVACLDEIWMRIRRWLENLLGRNHAGD
jgi:hypothetical protein